MIFNHTSQPHPWSQMDWWHIHDNYLCSSILFYKQWHLTQYYIHLNIFFKKEKISMFSSLISFNLFCLVFMFLVLLLLYDFLIFYCYYYWEFASVCYFVYISLTYRYFSISFENYICIIVSYFYFVYFKSIL